MSEWLFCLRFGIFIYKYVRRHDAFRVGQNVCDNTNNGNNFRRVLLLFDLMNQIRPLVLEQQMHPPGPRSGIRMVASLAHSDVCCLYVYIDQRQF